MRRFPDVADGDVCAQDPAHGRMFFLRPDRQFCAHAQHRGLAIHDRDGRPVLPSEDRRSPVGPSMGAPETANGQMGLTL